MQLHRPQDDFACAPILIGCAGLGAIQHVHALYFAGIDLFGVTTTTAYHVGMPADSSSTTCSTALCYAATLIPLANVPCLQGNFFRFPKSRTMPTA